MPLQSDRAPLPGLKVDSDLDKRSPRTSGLEESDFDGGECANGDRTALITRPGTLLRAFSHVVPPAP
jgi:hypothetical protein